MPYSGPHGASSSSLTPEEFASSFEASARILWTLAAAVLGNRSQVEDVLQEAAVIGLQKLDQFDRETRFVAWMGRIVRFVALNQVRMRGRRNTHTSAPEDLDREVAPAVPAPQAYDPGGGLLADGGHFDDALAGALMELRPVARACLLLKTLHDLDYREISEALGVPPGTAMSHVHRARQVLRKLLADHEENQVRRAEA